MTDLNERLDNLKKIIQEPDFLEGKGLSNEVNINIFCYDPKEEMKIRYFVEKLKQDNSLKNCNILAFDLFELFIEVSNDRKLIHKYVEKEKKSGKEALLNSIKKVVSYDKIIDKMDLNNNKHMNNEVVIIYGVGRVHPFLKLHMILNEIQKVTDLPIIALYPGKYDGLTVSLFGEFESSSYYRAFNRK